MQSELATTTIASALQFRFMRTSNQRLVLCFRAAVALSIEHYFLKLWQYKSSKFGGYLITTLYW